MLVNFKGAFVAFHVRHSNQAEEKKTHTDCEIDNSQMKLLAITLAYLHFSDVRE